MTDNTPTEAGGTHVIRYALEMGLLWIDGDGRDKVREALDALDTLEAQLASAGFTAADMATAESRGFRDGVASVAANAGEPVATVFTMEALTPGGGVNQVYTNIEPGDPTQEGMLLRDYFAAQVVSAVFHGVFEDWRQNKAGIQEDWPTGIAVDAYRIADAMLKIREAT